VSHIVEIELGVIAVLLLVIHLQLGQMNQTLDLITKWLRKHFHGY
jgi:hypothetical protein